MDAAQAHQEQIHRLAEETEDTALQAQTRIALASPLWGSYWCVEGHSLQHPGLLRMERGDDFFREDFGGPEDLDPQDIACIAELDSDAWRDLD
jgi:hypothetical protein